jgi:hypothetical protein
MGKKPAGREGGSDRGSTMATRWLVVWLVVAAFRPSVGPWAIDHWPVVQPIHAQYTFIVRGGRDTPVLLLVRDTHGRAVYKLECHDDDYEPDDEISFSGAFQCALFAMRDGRRTSWNLLADSTKNARSVDWWTRGRMLARQLVDSCGAYPEYGLERHFSVRGMVVTLRFGDLQWSRSVALLLTRFTVDISVAPNPRARTVVADVVPGPTPGRACGWW